MLPHLRVQHRRLRHRGARTLRLTRVHVRGAPRPHKTSAQDEYIHRCTIGGVTVLVTPVDDALERVGTALADPTRRRILLLLIDGGAYPFELAGRLGMGRTNISNHLACLRGCGLVRAQREGRKVRYELATAALGQALSALAMLDLDIDAHHCDLDGRG